MQISTKTLLDIITNKESKGVKKSVETPTTTKTETAKHRLLNSRDIPKKADIQESINKLLKELSSNTKTKQSVSLEIKQSDIPKLMKSTTTELKTVFNLIKNEKTLSKFAPTLEKLLTNIKDIKPENLKESLAKSGTLLESKLSSQKTETMPTALKEILTTLKESLSTDETQKPLKLKLLDTLLNAKKLDKSSLQTLKALTQELKNSPNLPKTIEPSIQKLDTILTKNIIPKDIKTLLTNIKTSLTKESPNSIKLLDTLLSAKKPDKAFVQTLKALTQELKNSPNLPKTTEPSIQKLDTILTKNIIPKDIKTLLANIKTSLTKTADTSPSEIKLIDKILNTPKADKSFIDDIKTVITNLKKSPNPDRQLIKITAKLEELTQKSSLIESKIQNSPQTTPKDLTKITTDIKQSLTELKDILQSSKKEPTQESKQIATLVEQSLKSPELFSRDLTKATISEKLQQIVNLIKSDLIKTDKKNPKQIEIERLTNKLESVIKEQIATKQIVPNQKLTAQTLLKQELTNDIKATLLHVKHQLSSQNTPASKEISLHVDRAVTQIEYYQLLSLSSNSQTTYLPFLWDGLEEGQVSLKKLKENRFFCEINLKLKEHGKIDLMLMLFEDIHLNISVFAEKEEFLKIFQESLPQLKQSINKLGLIPSTLQLKQRDEKQQKQNFFDSLGTGLNIEV